MELSRTESHHLISVMRSKAGDRVELFDGKGKTAGAIVDSISRKQATVSVTDVKTVQRPDKPRVVIAAGVAKGQRFDWLVSKCTELGVDCIAAVSFERAVKQPKGETAMERYRNLAVAAMKQCGSIFMPRILLLGSLEDALKSLAADYPDGRFVFGSFGPGAKPVKNILQNIGDIIAFTGPEGGFTQKELDMLAGAGAEGVRLTETVLRTETAAIAFASVLCTNRDADHG